MKTDKPYTAGPMRMMKQLRKSYGFGSKKGVRYRSTCPVCGTTLVNLYLVDDSWKCNKCKEKKDA